MDTRTAKLLKWMAEAIGGGSVVFSLVYERGEWMVSVVDGLSEFTASDPDFDVAVGDLAVQIKSDRWIPPDPDGVPIELVR